MPIYLVFVGNGAHRTCVFTFSDKSVAIEIMEDQGIDDVEVHYLDKPGIQPKYLLTLDMLKELD